MKITHSSFQLEMDEIMSEIKNLSKNIYIETYVDIPEVSIIRLQLFNLFLYHASVPQHLRKVYCVTAGLIQMGLDLHETITNQKEVAEKNIRNRQLSILAGDYFSSKFYSLLAQNNLTNEVEKLAYAISNINNVKMKLYTANNGAGFDSVDQIIHLVKIKESNLYTQFMEQMNAEEFRLYWKYVIEHTILLFSLSDELQEKDIASHHFSHFLIKYYANKEEKKEIVDLEHHHDVKLRMNNLYHKYDIHHKVKDLMHNIYYDLQQKINGLEDRVIKGELLYILNQFSRHDHLLLNAMEKI